MGGIAGFFGERGLPEVDAEVAAGIQNCGSTPDVLAFPSVLQADGRGCLPGGTWGAD